MGRRKPLATVALLEQPTTALVDQRLPELAKDDKALNELEAVLRNEPTNHRLRVGDARDLRFLPDESIHLVVTSPPYWTLKKYNDHDNQLGALTDYKEFHAELNKVWRECLRVLVPGGRLVCVVGDVVVSRRSALGRHKCFPLHADIQVNCEAIGFDNLAPIFWSKISNAKFEAEGNSGGFLGKPFEPGAIIKNDVEFILSFRKPGGYRSPTPRARLLSTIAAPKQKTWFTQIWGDIPGASLKNHPAPFPEALADRLIRMFSFAGDTVLDPFSGTGTTMVAAAHAGRNSMGIELDPQYAAASAHRIREATSSFHHNRTFAFEVANERSK